MPNKIITKNSIVVIFLAILSAAAAGCHRFGVSGETPPPFDAGLSDYEAPKISGRIQSDEVTESSGLAVSRCQDDLLWTHNDSGDGPYIFAMDNEGRHRGVWKIGNADNKDWESMASYKDSSGKCFLVIGDTGNSKKEARTEHKIYRIPEPEAVPNSALSSRKRPLQAAPAEVLAFSYPDELQDAETLLVSPDGSEIYVLTKQSSKPSGVYRLKVSFGGPPIKAERIAEISVPAIPNGLLTGGDIAPDGEHLVICDYFAAYEFELPAGAASFDEIWKQKPRVISLGDREQGESIAYSPDGITLFATSEGKHTPLTTVRRLSP